MKISRKERLTHRDAFSKLNINIIDLGSHSSGKGDTKLYASGYNITLLPPLTISFSAYVGW